MQAFSLCVRRYIVWLIISMHLAISFPAFSESTHPDSSSTESPVVFEYSDTLTSVGLDLNSSVENAMKNRITNTGASTVQEWLNQFGTAEVHLNVDDNGNWDNSSLDYLQPLYDNKKSVLFTQLGMRAPNGRFTTNIGFGVRTFYLDDWMFGANFFFDHDFEGGNRRVGVGGEAWTDNFKLSANTYAGTTDWHNSRDFDGYYEKPADGFDVRMEAFLPSYPQLGGRMMYEKYYGNQVALFDKDHLQKNPSAVTVGLNYTPVPLITAGVDYRRGQNSLDETKFTLNFRYDLGRSWQEQTSSDQVALRRSLAGSRYDLVERNNEIILQYKKKETRAVLADMILSTIKDNSPADGIAANTVTLHAVTSDGSPVANASINWAVTGGAKLSEETGTTDSNGYASVNLTNTTAEHVTVTATSGSIVRTAPTSFSMSVASLDLVLTKNNSQADGIDQNAGQVTLKDASGKTLPGVAINWQVGDAATVVSSDNSTDSKGQATIHFTSTTAGSVKLTASANNKTESVNATFADQLVSNIAVTMTTDGSPADGSTPNVAQALVTSAGGQPMPNVSVTWTLSGSATAATATTL
ncbi:inverse autotransporter beta domain-containing protein, partial [Kluyvera intermedia]|uniref:inverse autotransporter beta domain-containing protein n=1 Tax=Kluyvera intermedia TaxID=61648 RepID=UPI0035232EE6